MRDSKVIQVAAAAILLGAVISIAITVHGSFPPSINAKPHQAAGWALAKQTLSLLKPGGQILLITRDTTEFKNPALDFLLQAFKQEVQKTRPGVITIQALQVDPLRPIEVPNGEFSQWIRKSKSGSVIVSFMGPPLLSASQRTQLGVIKPSIVAFCPGNWSNRVNLRSLFDQGLLTVAIASQRNPPPASASPRSQQDWFDLYFKVVTSENVVSFSPLAGVSPPQFFATSESLSVIKSR